MLSFTHIINRIIKILSYFNKNFILRLDLPRELFGRGYERSITATDIMLFMRQFATLHSAGISILKSCEILERIQEKRRMCILIYSIKRELLCGKNLFYSLRERRDYFDALTCQLVKLGEQTGKLDVMLCKIADHHEKNMAIKKRIKQALFYPAVITLTALAVTFAMFLFVIPRFTELFKESGTALPLLTLFIFNVSDLLHENIFYVIAMVMLSMLSFIFIKRSTHNKFSLQSLIKHLPFIGSLQKKIILSRFIRCLAVTFESGLPIKDALQLTLDEAYDRKFVTLIASLINKINSGLQLHQAMEMLFFFPPIMIQMIKVGEESSLLTPMLNRLADFFEADIDAQTCSFSQLLEPLIMIILGVLIGGLVIGLYLPIFKLGSTL
jgi:type IV pilus assembly protein PilC